MKVWWTLAIITGVSVVVTIFFTLKTAALAIRWNMHDEDTEPLKASEKSLARIQKQMYWADRILILLGATFLAADTFGASNIVVNLLAVATILTLFVCCIFEGKKEKIETILNQPS